MKQDAFTLISYQFIKNSSLTNIKFLVHEIYYRYILFPISTIQLNYYPIVDISQSNQ